MTHAIYTCQQPLEGGSCPEGAGMWVVDPVFGMPPMADLALSFSSAFAAIFSISAVCMFAAYSVVLVRRAASSR